MTEPWEKDECAAMHAHFALYSIPQAAALWCGVPDEQLEKILTEVTNVSAMGLGRSIYRHPRIKCIEPRSRAIAEAIENGELPFGREDGKIVTGEHVAYERRHFFGRDLRAWMKKNFPNEKPAFLFDDIERSSHPSISIDAYRTLKAERDGLQKRLENAKQEYKKLREQKETIESEYASLKSITEKDPALGKRVETTYKNIIAALLQCISGDIPGVAKHPSFSSESQLIEKIDALFEGYQGLSKSNLSRKFPEAKKFFEQQ